MASAANNTGGVRPPVAQPAPQTAAKTNDRADSIIANALGTPTDTPTGSTPGDTRATQPETVTVKSGDTISQIAARYQISADQLKTLNPQLFQDGADDAGKKRGADGRLIYPGDVIRLRAQDASPADPAKTTTVSNKVSQAAKDYLDSASVVPPDAAGGKGRDVSQKVLDSARTMLGLIPASDPQYQAYADKVAKLQSNFQAQYPDPSLGQKTGFQDASKAFNTATKSYQDAAKLAGQVPPEDIQAFQQDTAQRAIDAYTDASKAVQAMPDGQDKQLSASQLEMMQYALGQMGIATAMIQAAATQHVTLPPLATTKAPVTSNTTTAASPGSVSAIMSGGGGDGTTQQTIGPLPGTVPAAAPAQQPAAAPTQQPAAQPAQATPAPVTASAAPATTGGPASVNPVSASAGNTSATPAATTATGNSSTTQSDGTIPIYTATEIPVYKSTYASANPGAGANGANGSNGTNGANGSNGANGANGSNGANNSGGTIAVNPPAGATNSNASSGPSQPDPNSPAAKKLDAFLQHASHKDVDNMVSTDFNTFYGSTAQQKARMIQILLEGRTNGTDQSTIAQIVDMARQQGQSDAMIAALDQMYGGPGKGVNRMFGDLKRGVRDQVIQALFGDPPDGTKFNPNFYNEVIAGMDKKDVEHLCNTLGTTPGSAWMDRIPANAKMNLANLLKSWWPFGGDKGLRAALLSSAAGAPTQAAPAPTQAAPAQTTAPQAGH